MSKKYLLPLMIVAIAATLGSCSSNPTPTSSTTDSPNPANTQSSIAPIQSPSMAQLRAKSPNVEPAETTTPPAVSQTTKPKIEPLDTNTSTGSDKTATAPKTVNVTLFTSDTQCQELIPQKVAVPAEEPVTSAVGKIIDERDTADFSLSGYRVKVQNGVATVDLRLSPESKRQLASLSSCEQFALFGSLRKTLTSNPQWKIKEVRFTEKGEEIVL
ncbi:GerMN domain-containing protein [Nostoc sp. FACHB-110]|uniref:GerMN domain-containing protein n=1 Tax=Nostoc sp. FACHB-110 TaxID=2692834 RepID=UPI00168764F6|nr:GerMN domain-containing protein [Nostoc sp. FACHB-110]MBD2439617.1 GerMN domain-containing protein [Nostoc sp. FACHB-110]